MFDYNFKLTNENIILPEQLNNTDIASNISNLRELRESLKIKINARPEFQEKFFYEKKYAILDRLLTRMDKIFKNFSREFVVYDNEKEINSFIHTTLNALIEEVNLAKQALIEKVGLIKRYLRPATTNSLFFNNLIKLDKKLYEALQINQQSYNEQSQYRYGFGSAGNSAC